MQPLEQYLRDYLDSAGGLWDLVEPAVYDTVLPESMLGMGANELFVRGTGGTARVVFDPEAVAEHPGSQFLTLGTPLLDGMLSDGQKRGRHVRAWVTGLNVSPFDLARKVRSAIRVPAGTSVDPQSHEVRNVTILVLRFEAEFASDQKETATFEGAVELHSGRPVRHLASLAMPDRLVDEPVDLFPAADRLGLAEGYSLIRDKVMRTVGAVANQRRRDVLEHTQRQIGRMARYYHDLMDELEEQARRSASRGDDPDKARSRKRAVELERDSRLAELRRKSEFRVMLTLTNIVELIQPKLMVPVVLRTPGRVDEKIAVVWDPATEAVEPMECPRCAQPGFALGWRRGAAGWVCDKCLGA